MGLFIPIYKVDEEQHMVYGRAADETPDGQKEVWDYDGNKPLMAAWSQRFNDLTDGKSLGNVREQHDMKKAAGKVTDIAFDDGAKSVDVAVKVIDAAAWEKVKEGVFTGFSVGGRYVKKWADKARTGINRVIIDPTEISLVDMGANPSATFTAVKADGITEERVFKISAENAGKVSKREDVNPKEGENKYGDVEFADEKNKKYPIDTAAHIRAAWNYINKPKNAKLSGGATEIKAKIVAAWKKKIDPKGPPSAAEKAMQSEARKGMYTVGQLAAVLESLQWMHTGVEMERDTEGDESDLPERLGEAIQGLADIFLEMADEETKELLAGILPDGASEE